MTTSTLAGLLEELNPDGLAELRNEFPDHVEMLQPGVTLGEPEDPQEEKRREVRYRLTRRTLTEVSKQASAGATAVRSRMLRASKWGTIAEVVSVVSTSGVIGLIVTSAGREPAIAMAILGLAGSLAALFSRRGQQTLLGGRPLQEVLTELVEISSCCASLIRELPILRADGGSVEALDERYAMASDLADRANKILPFLVSAK